MEWQTIVVYVLIVIVVLQIGLAFIIFPFLRKKRNDKLVNEQKQLINAIKVGSEILLTSGIFAKVKQKNDGFLIVSIANNVDIKITKDAIMGFFDAEIAKKIEQYKNAK